VRDVKYTLDWTELLVCGVIGVVRRVASLQNGRRDQGLGPSDWTVDIEGVAGELAVARHLDVYCMPKVNSFKVADVAGYHVRSTKYSDGKLIIRPKDDEDAPYILTVTGDLPHVRVIGLLPAGRDARKPEYDYKGDSWWVPQEHLVDLPERR